MALKDILKVSRKTFLDPASWLGFDLLKTHTKVLTGLVKEATTAEQPTREETFEQAMQRLQLTEKDIKERIRDYQLYLVFFGLLALCSLAWVGYWIYHINWRGAVLTLLVTALLLSKFFRYHFWLFQLKNRKLGCTFQEWSHRKVGG